PDVMERIKSIAAEQELLVPDMPVAGNEIFDRKYCEENKDKLDRVYNLLADGQSRRVFEAVIDFKLSGRIDQLIDCETTPAEAFENIIKPTDSEIFVDLGAYNGDTVAEFLAFGKANKIYAVEPDARNFKKLTANTAELQSCVCVNAAVSDKPGKVHFSAKSGRNSAILGEGSKIDCVSVDSLLCGNPATYIKMDVEGAEGSAVCGARQTIEKYKPKMLISCYHRSCDLFDIPERVLKVRPDYKIFMRHYPYIPAWDTAFYFV
ncbi:MAG: FkbM family methyltransferase, partial [Clostridia bacterium]|nr:FkbM family methyltransferase [Clostridia bacterium]